MLQNAILFKLANGWPQSASDLEAAFATEPFQPCSATQQQSTGWVPPRGHDHGALVETISGQWLARFVIETRKVPADAVRKKTKELADAVTRQTGREPGRKELRDLREDAVQALLPQAFPKRTDIPIWIDPDTRVMWIDTSTQSKADELIASLVRHAQSGFGLRALQTTQSPQAAMATWLSAPLDQDAMPEAFSSGMECELKGCGDEPSVIKFSKHTLQTDQVRQNIAEGKLPTKMALQYQDRIEFVLTDRLIIKKIRFLESAVAGAGLPDQEGQDRFDADAALATGELRPMLTDLVAALDGELVEQASP